jgi:hypothetical protein
MIEYEILRPLPFFLTGYTVTEEELEKQFTRDAINDLVESGFISKVKSITTKKVDVFKHGIRTEILNTLGIEATKEVLEILDEFLDKIYADPLWHEKIKEKPVKITLEHLKKAAEYLKETRENLEEEQEKELVENLIKRFGFLCTIEQHKEHQRKVWREQNERRVARSENQDYKEKPIPTWRENPPIKNESLKNEKIVQDFMKNSFNSIYYLKERATQSMIPIGLSFTAIPGEKVTSEKSEESKKESEIKIPKFEEIKRLGGYFLNHRNFINSIRDGHKTTENYNVYPTEELVKAAQVQGKLYQCYHEALRLNCPDWKYSWSDNQTKWCVASFMDRLTVETTYNYKYPFPFPTKELAQAFLDTHKEDLEIYKPLM